MLAVVATSCVTPDHQRKGALVVVRENARVGAGLTGCADGESLARPVELFIGTTQQMISGAEKQYVVRGTLDTSGMLQLSEEATSELKNAMQSAEAGSFLVLLATLRASGGSLVEYQQGTPVSVLLPLLGGPEDRVVLRAGKEVRDDANVMLCKAAEP